MKKKLCIVFILCSSFVFSQIKITGVISDSLGMPVPYAPIGLLSLPDSNIIKGTMTDETGKYLINTVGIGNYMLKVSAIGYQDKIVENIVVDSSTTDNLLFDLKLNASLHSIDEVTVTAIKRVVEFINGNIIVNVENSPLAKGNSVFDLLTKLPGVSVDNNKIMIQGKAGVIVMIDKRPQTLSGDQLVNLLKSMNADLVKSIEILKNPPVKYDASGTSGMINIVSKKVSVSGLTGTVFSSCSQGFYERLLSGTSLNYKSDKIVFYSNLSGDFSHYRSVEKFNKRFTTDSTTMNLSTVNTAKVLETNFNYKAGLDWFLSKTDIIGIKAEGGPGKNISTTNSRNAVSGYNNLGFDHLDSKITQPDLWNTDNFNFNFDHKIDTLGSSFSVVTDYTRLTENISSDNKNFFYDLNESQTLSPNNYRSDNQGNSNVFSGRADFTKFIDSSSSFESGIKTAYAKTSNNYLFERDYANNGMYSMDTNLSNKFQYTELTYAGYFNYIKSVEKINMQLGFRLEKTFLNGENDRNFSLHKEYFNIFPNLSFDYRKSDNHDFQLNLSRRIDRPNFYDLNPFLFFKEQYSFYKGNPFLLPDYSNRGELTYNFKNSISTSVAYSFTQNVLLSYTSQNDSTKVTYQSTKNMNSSSALEYSFFYQESLTKRWDVSLSGTFASVNYKGDIDGIRFQRTGLNCFANFSNSILVGKNAKIEVNGIYIGPNIVGIIQVKPRWMASLALNMSLCKEKLDLTLGVDDIFYSFIVKSEASFENQNWNFSNKSDTRRFRVSLNYKFGKIKIEERNVNGSNEEEKERFNH